VELTMLSPAWAMLWIAIMDAACPEETASAAAPPSSAARRCSSTSQVGFMIRV
jgi:hypothetical protein